MIKNIIDRIKEELINTFDDVDRWFEIDENLSGYKPLNGGWSIKEILEHISLTNHFLLILIKKGTKKAVELSAMENFSGALVNYDLDWHRLKTIGEHNSFEWNRPAHMEPTGKESMDVVRKGLKDQLKECLDCLQQLTNGEGVLYKTTMTVNGLGKIDVYHYLFFLAQHAKRHLMQMRKIKNDFLE
jgi:hypothetical protein